jgi:hypothetical protein
MKVTPHYLILLVVILFALYTFGNIEKFECTKDDIVKAYSSRKMKPRRPEHMECISEKDSAGTEKETCKNKTYNDDQILANFRVEGVPDKCILELVKVWKW